MENVSADESLKLAMAELQKNQVLDMMRSQLRRLVDEVVYAMNGTYDLEAGDQWVDGQVALCLERMLSICTPEMWEAIAKPIMDKRTAEHMKMLAIQSLTLEAALNPIPQFIRDLAQGATTEPSGKDLKVR